MRGGRKISKKPASILLILCVLVLIPAGIVHPQEKPLLVAIEVLAPCVMKSDGGYTGFENEIKSTIIPFTDWVFSFTSQINTTVRN